MAAKGEIISAAAGGFGNLPLIRQLGLLVGLAVSIALGVSIVLWSMEPEFRPLYSDLNEKDTAAVLDVLQRSNIPYKLDNSGKVLVSQASLNQARLKLAAEGLPRGASGGMEFLEQNKGLGSSQFMESLRYINALEGELARTIGHMENVKAARVHLSVPKQSSFLNDNRKPTASVFVDLYAGASLNRTQIAAIVNLVASSVPSLNSDNVTLVDGAGRLLTEGSGTTEVGLADRYFNYRQMVEDAYAKQVNELLTPILGPGKVHAQISVDMDFTRLEQTQELYDPDNTSVRSEQSMEEQRQTRTASAEGVPGALSNQPPAGTSVSPTPTPAANAPGAVAAGAAVVSAAETAAQKTVITPRDSRKQLTRNFEIDKTINYLMKQPGQVRRLSVAVLVDDHTSINRAGKVERTPLKPEEIAEITRLVKDSVGFNAERGDSITVVNRSFAEPPPMEPLPKEGFFEKAWVQSLLKQVAGGAVLLILMFGVLKPLLQNLATRSAASHHHRGQLTQGSGSGSAGAGGASTPTAITDDAAEQEELRMLGASLSYEEQMQAVKKLATQDPKRVAHIVKKWVEDA